MDRSGCCTAAPELMWGRLGDFTLLDLGGDRWGVMQHGFWRTHSLALLLLLLLLLLWLGRLGRCFVLSPTLG